MLDFDAGDEEDEELMKFLQVRGGEEEERERERRQLFKSMVCSTAHTHLIWYQSHICMAVVLLLTASLMSHSFYMQHAVIEVTVLEVCAWYICTCTMRLLIIML